MSVLYKRTLVNRSAGLFDVYLQVTKRDLRPITPNADQNEIR